MKMPSNKKLNKAGIYAELGQYSEALKLSKSSRADSAAKTEFQKSIYAVVGENLQKNMTVLQSKDSSSWEKYQAIQKINGMKAFRLKGIRQAVQTANKAKLSKAVASEERAAKEYKRIMSKYKPDSKRSVDATERYLSNLARAYPDTHYGKLAAEGL